MSYLSSSVFSSFLRGVEDLISSQGCHRTPWGAVQHHQDYLNLFLLFSHLTLEWHPFPGVLKFQDSPLIIVFALSNLICQRKATFSWGKEFFPIHTPKWLAELLLFSSSKASTLSRWRERERDVRGWYESSFSPLLFYSCPWLTCVFPHIFCLFVSSERISTLVISNLSPELFWNDREQQAGTQTKAKALNFFEISC